MAFFSSKELARELAIENALCNLITIEKVVKQCDIDDAKRVFSVESIIFACKEIGFSQKATVMLSQALQPLLKDQRLLFLASLLHAYLFKVDVSIEIKENIFNSLPELPVTSCDEKAAAFFYALVLLSGYNFVKSFHLERGIPHNITQDTLIDTELWINKHEKRKGSSGFSEKCWLINHFMGTIFKLGRLQFRFEKFPSNLFVLRHIHSNQVIVVVSKKDIAFRKNGQYSGSSGIRETHEWLSTFERDEVSITATPIDPIGKAIPEPVLLNLKDWKIVLGKNSPTLGVHIPETGPMELDECAASFQQAREFFAKYFPDRPYQAFTCYSWLCDTEWRRLLPEKSNIRKFSESWYLFPVLNERGSDGLFIQLFGKTFDNLDDVPQTSSLLRTIVSHLKNGGELNGGGGVFFPDELPFRQNVYHFSFNAQ